MRFPTHLMCSLVGGRSNVVPFVRSVIKLGPPFAVVLNMRKDSWTFFRLLGRRNSYHASLAEGFNITDEMLSPRSFARQLVDQISLAKAFLVISKESNNLQFAAELSTQIRYSQALLSRVAASGRAVASEEFEKAIRDMAVLLFQAQQLHYDSSTTIVKMKVQIQSLEEKAKLEADKSTRYGQIAAEELPKGLYCLGIRLTVEWFRNPPHHRKMVEAKRTSERLRDNSLYHYCVFSDNIVAVSVVVNSTTMNSKRPDLIVFHLVTDEVNYIPMKAWFSMNSFHGATVEVLKVEDFSWLNASYVPVLKQLQNTETQNFYFSSSGNGKIPIKFRNPKYLSMLNHLRFYIPEVYPALNRVVFLDDDVVVQKDLSELFTINLNGNVMGAVETCMETFHRFHKYLNYSHPLIRVHFDPDACGWAFGMNVIDLKEWQKKNVTGIYHYWQEQNTDHTLWKLGSLPPGLLAFYGLVETLDPKWHVLGLGYTNVDPSVIKEGAVLHYNGNMKPWLKIGMEKYKGLWDKYVDYSHPLLQRCLLH
ncbi:probable galacturonosyltransferase 10 [Ananas comosus]|uniref:Hexosyltransferase n=1 Tax=Ananas comosus TaxID=4615 RepID=A0A6P5G519_ANACO|nr:probable galacturonosyltransferase 10 [Ananas comosus]